MPVCASTYCAHPETFFFPSFTPELGPGIPRPKDKAKTPGRNDPSPVLRLGPFKMLWFHCLGVWRGNPLRFFSLLTWSTTVNALDTPCTQPHRHSPPRFPTTIPHHHSQTLRGFSAQGRAEGEDPGLSTDARGSTMAQARPWDRPWGAGLGAEHLLGPFGEVECEEMGGE